jgi:hypothetical protein
MRRLMWTLTGENRREHGNPNADGTMAGSYGSGYGYNKESEIDTAQRYKSMIPHLDTHVSEDKALYDRAIYTVAAIIGERRTPHFINFGASYAHIDARLAVMFPDTRFICVDRSEAVRQLNTEDFGAIENMEFVVGNILSLLKPTVDGGILFTSRTLTLLPKGFVAKLYDTARKAGIEFIVGMEPTGISRETGSEYQFSKEADLLSVWYRGQMFIHNYPHLLKESGYEHVEFSLVKTGHPHPDFRIASFVGVRP